MKYSTQLLETQTPRGRRYYADGKRISRATMADIKHGARLDTFQTVIKGDVTRHYCVATRESAS